MYDTIKSKGINKKNNNLKKKKNIKPAFSFCVTFTIRLGKRGLIYLLLFTCNYVVSVWRGFLFLWVLGMGYVILLWHSLNLPLIIKLFLYLL